MKVLVACEESQTVCKAFRERGHEAYSCDIQECSGGAEHLHVKGNCLPIINGDCTFRTMDGKWHTIEGSWDLLIAHPPCTYLTVTGNSWFNESKYHANAIGRYMDRMDSMNFFMQFVYSTAKRFAIENPVGIMSSVYRKPDQIIEPYEYGHPTTKKTCLWLKNLPILTPTNIVDPSDGLYTYADGRKDPLWHVESIGMSPDERSRYRSKTFQGIADAMADQWGSLDE